MPKLTVYFPITANVTVERLKSAKIALAELVAGAASTSSVPLTAADVDVIMSPYEPDFCTFVQDVAIELETFGYPERKAKLTESAMLHWKHLMAGVLIVSGFKINREKPLLWLKYVDPDGHHV